MCRPGLYIERGGLPSVQGFACGSVHHTVVSVERNRKERRDGQERNVEIETRDKRRPGIQKNNEMALEVITQVADREIDVRGPQLTCQRAG